MVPLSLERRILHVDVTAHPHAAWTAQPIIEAVGPDVEVTCRLVAKRRSRALLLEGCVTAE